MQAVSAIITHLQAVLMSTGWLACAVTAACEDCAYGLQFVMHVVCFSCDDGIHKCVQVKWPDGSCKECLVPYASLLNHSVRPHIVQYGQLDAQLGSYAFPCSGLSARGASASCHMGLCLIQSSCCSMGWPFQTIHMMLCKSNLR